MASVKRPRRGIPTFPVTVKQEIGSVELDPSADDSPGIAAFRIVDTYIQSQGEGEFEFTIPDGVTIEVRAVFHEEGGS